jgi:hypothetical protein
MIIIVTNHETEIISIFNAYDNGDSKNLCDTVGMPEKLTITSYDLIELIDKLNKVLIRVINK